MVLMRYRPRVAQLRPLTASLALPAPRVLPAPPAPLAQQPHARPLARAERRQHDAAGLDDMLAIDPVIERAEGGVEEKDAGAVHAR